VDSVPFHLLFHQGGTPERFCSFGVQANPRIARGEEPELHHVLPDRVNYGLGATGTPLNVEVHRAHSALGGVSPVGRVDDKDLVRILDPE